MELQMSPPELQINNPEIVTHRELATHANDIMHLQADMDRLISDFEEMKQSVQRIERMLAEEHAKDRTISKVITIISGLVGGLIVWALERVIK
jgi:hypothetical protein